MTRKRALHFCRRSLNALYGLKPRPADFYERRNILAKLIKWWKERI